MNIKAVKQFGFIGSCLMLSSRILGLLSPIVGCILKKTNTKYFVDLVYNKGFLSMRFRRDILFQLKLNMLIQIERILMLLSFIMCILCALFILFVSNSKYLK